MLNRKFKKMVLCLVLIGFGANFANAQQEILQINKWITNWYLLGPIELEEGLSEANHLGGFEKDVLSKHGGETDLHVINGPVEKIDSASLAWFKYTSPDSTINLDEAISKRSYVAAYAYKEIFAEEEGTYILSLGTNDGGRLWINGVEIWDYPDARALTPDDDLIPVFLQKGRNQILLKVEERGNNWGFCIRILQFNIDEFMKNEDIFDVVTSPNGESELRFVLNAQVAENLFSFVNMAINSTNKKSDLIWDGEWTKKSRMVLDLDNQVAKPYMLHIIAESKSGKKWKNKILFKSGKRNGYTLFSNKKTDYRIIVGEDASESEQWSAKELQDYLFEISGATFAIESDDSDLTKNEIVIGFNKHSQQLLGDNFDMPELMDESFTYQNVQSNIVLLGGRQRGTMYAVISFLENTFGVRWYTPKVTVVPKRENYTFDYIYHFEKPSIQVRNDFYYEAFDPIWAAHNRINGAMGFREQPGGIEGYWGVHTFYRFMPPSEFFDEHPEYYSLIDGKRTHERTQLCLTNPDVLDIITERLRQAMRENPNNLIYSVSQNDWRNPCKCNNCKAIVDDEGAQSGIMLWFVNQVADRIKEEFPDKYIGTLAYDYTRKPPEKIKPKENVVIRFCSIECCFAHDFNSCPKNQDFLSDLQRWSVVSPHMYIWDYVVNFNHYIMPFPNFNVLQPNIKTFLDNNSIGIMEQAAFQSRGGEFAELRAYVIAKILWDTECNVDEVIDDFMYGYYGRSGQYVREYLDLLHAQLTPETHIYLGLKPDDIIFPEKFIIEADKIFNKAEIVAESTEILERVEMARLPLMYLKCVRNPVNSKYDGTYDKFNIVVKREGITHLAELGEAHVKDFHSRILNAK